MTRLLRLLPVAAAAVILAFCAPGCAPRMAVETKEVPTPTSAGMDVARPPAVPDAGEWHGTLNQTGSGAKPVGRVRMIVGQEGAFTASVTQGTTGEEGGIWAGAFQPSGAIDGEFTQGMQSWSVTGTVAREGERVVGVLTLAKSNYAADRVGAELELRRGPAPSPAAKAPPP